jgi:hypothetical protein
MNARATTVMMAIVIGALLGIAAGTLLALSANHNSYEPPEFNNKVGVQFAVVT